MAEGTRGARVRRMPAWGAALILGAALAAPRTAAAQDRHRDRGDDYRSVRDRDGRSDRSDHDRGSRAPARDAGRAWTRSSEGRRFQNGVELRRGAPLGDRAFDHRFGGRVWSYPYYAPSRSAAVVLSPYGFYFGLVPSYVARSRVILAPPTRVYIDVPVYVGGAYRSYPTGDGYYLHRGSSRDDDNRWKDDAELRKAVYDLEDSFRDGDITLLAPLTDRDTKVAIFSQGKYDYSVEANDYLDMTRDFMRTASTTSFSVYRVHYKTRGVYQAFARHNYRDADGNSRTVYLCFVFERVGGRWTITQVDTSPDRLQP